jgi:hypothetical protein
MPTYSPNASDVLGRSFIALHVARGGKMKTGLRTLAIATGLAIATTALPALAAFPAAPMQDRDHQYTNTDRRDHPEYNNNRYYRLGNKEGYTDYNRKVQRKEHTHNYKNDNDRQAHDYGYQQGWSGTRYDSRNPR